MDCNVDNQKIKIEREGNRISIPNKRVGLYVLKESGNKCKEDFKSVNMKKACTYMEN